MKNILVPCDFSEAAREAFKFAVQIASKTGGKIHVIYVVDITFLHGKPSLSHSYAFNINFLKEIESEAENKFQEMWERHAPLTLPVTFKHCMGTLLTEVKNYIDAHGIDLVVMGTEGEGKARWGSNTNKVIQHSKPPVFAIRKNLEQLIILLFQYYRSNVTNTSVANLKNCNPSLAPPCTSFG